jgi:hypothetical protein
VLEVQLQAPSAVAVVVHSTVPPWLTVTALPASAVPVKVGVVVGTSLPATGARNVGAPGGVVSTVKLLVAGALTLPAASVAVTDSVYVPSASVETCGQLQAPLPSAVVVQSVLPSSTTVTVEFGSALPATTGALLLMTALSAGVAMSGAEGAPVSTVKVLVLEATLVLPAASVAVAFAVCDPSASVVLGVKLQLPLLLATVVPTTEPSMLTVTVALASAVPVMGTCGSPVTDPFAGVATTGAAGGVVSMVNESLAGWLTLPAASFVVAVTVFGPAGSVVLDVHDQWPVASTATLAQSTVPPFATVSVVPASAVPEKLGAVVLIDEPLTGLAKSGAAGAVVSMVKVSVPAGLTLPAVSRSMAVSAFAPSAKVAAAQAQLPAEFTAATQMVVPPSVTVTVELGFAVPDTVWVLLFDTEPSTGDRNTGAPGTAVSTVKVELVDTVLPAASAATAVRVCTPSGKVCGVGQLHEKGDVVPVVVVQMVVAPSVTVTVRFFSEDVPDTVCALTLVLELLGGLAMDTEAGAVVSMVKVSEAADEVLPAASLAVADSVCEPCENVVAVGHVQAPPELAVTVQMVVAPSVTVTVEFASAVPDGV